MDAQSFSAATTTKAHGHAPFHLYVIRYHLYSLKMAGNVLLGVFHRRMQPIASNTIALILLFLLINNPNSSNAIDTNSHALGDKPRTKLTTDILAAYRPHRVPNGYVNGYMVDMRAQPQFRDEDTPSIRGDDTRWRSISPGNERVDRRSRRDISAVEANTSASQRNGNDFVQSTLSTNTVNLLPEDVELNDTLTAIDLYGLFVHQNLSDILTLNVSSKQLKRIDANIFDALTNIRHFDASANELNAFDLRVPHNHLESLDLSNNRINSIDVRNQTQLKYLDLTCNDIADAGALHITGMAHLQTLDLSGNRLDALPEQLFVGTQQLKSVQLMANRFEHISKSYFWQLNDIEVLNLANNRIRAIENETFSHLLNLQYLDLAYNRLDKASVRALQGIPDLAHLSVAFNRQLGNALQGFVSSWSLKYLDASGTGLCEVPSALAQSVHTLNISYNTFPVSEKL